MNKNRTIAEYFSLAGIVVGAGTGLYYQSFDMALVGWGFTALAYFVVGNVAMRV